LKETNDSFFTDCRWWQAYRTETIIETN
jgi:hypothetical protein